MAGYRFGNKAQFGTGNTMGSGSLNYCFGSGNSMASDLSMVIGAANTVPSGANHTLVAGLDNVLGATAEEGLTIGSGNLVSGANSFVCGQENELQDTIGDYNIMVGISNIIPENNVDYAAVFGNSCTGGARGSLSWGRNNSNDPDYNGSGYGAVGGSGNLTSGASYGLTVGDDNLGAEEFNAGIQMGKNGASQNTIVGALTTSAGMFAAKGDAQLTTNLVLRGQTTDDVATVIYNDGGIANEWDLAANDTVLVKCVVLGRKTGDAGQSAAYELIASFKNQGGTSTIGTTGVTKVVLNEDTGTTDYDATLAVNDTRDTWELQVTGDSGHTVNWMAEAQVIKLNIA